jgi:hypothetical protein
VRYFTRIYVFAFSFTFYSISQAQHLPSTEEFQGLLTGCAIGVNLEVNTDLVGSIADIYRGDKTQGKLTIKNKTKFLELIPENDRLEAYKLYTACIKNILSKKSSNSYQPSYREPSEVEMKKAIIGIMQSRGGTMRNKNKIVVENPLNGMSIEIVDFEKLGCQPASYGTGYLCNFKSTTRLTAFSNEKSSAGQKHAQGVNLLLKLMMGGRDTTTETAIRRFIKGQGGWLVSEE